MLEVVDVPCLVAPYEVVGGGEHSDHGVTLCLYRWAAI